MVNQLEYLSIYDQKTVFVGASNLVNSPSWTGQIWYFRNEETIKSDIISNLENSISYPLTFSTCCGALFETNKIVVGNDVGMLAIYTVDETDELCPDVMTIYNNISHTAHHSGISSLTVDQTKSKVVTGSRDNSIKVWDLATFLPEISYDFAHVDNVSCVRFFNSIEKNSSSETFVSASLDGSCILWDRRAKHPAKVVLNESENRFKFVEWFENSTDLLFIGCDYGVIRLIDVRNPKETVLSQINNDGRSINTIRSFQYNAEKYLSVCEDSFTLKVYKFGTELTEVYKNEDHIDYVKDTAWLPNKGALLSCAWDSKIIRHQPLNKNSVSGDM